ncbi:hypothetical protein C0995_003422 [Termitomyces sp. Mi166|nr:hypothetical protein C0995_003422 [Termitomyces sp. Mi166\
MHFVDLIACLPYTISRLKPSCFPAEHNEDIVTIIKDLLNDHDMISAGYPSLCATNRELEARMQEKIEETHGLLPGQANKIVPLPLAASLIELGYHDCTFAEKLNMALLNWYLLYIDNESPKDVTAFVAFEEHFLRNLPQLDPLLDGLASCLHRMFDLYPTLFASTIINSVFDSIAGTCIEPSIQKLELPRTSTLFPWFLRQRNGAGLAYALMVFPKSRQVDYAVCFQALGDMEFWIAGINDILSYYKESIAGETTNYISNRATVQARAPLKVASDVRKDLLHSRKHIFATLARTAGQEAVKCWRTWEYGFM